MAPSLSTIERGNPPPRRKSCAACIKAKRRCDLRQPSCLRCSQRKLDCSYPAHSETQSRKGGETSSSQMGVSPTARPQELMKDPLAEISSWDSSFDFNMDLAPSYDPSCPSFPTISFDEPMLSGLEFLNEVVNMDNALNPIPPTPGLTPELALEDPMPLVPRSPKPQMASLSRIQLLRAASELTEKRLRYSIDAFKAAPEAMVLEGGTFWSHPALYRDSMPAFLEDALGACALHRAKNSNNRPMIQRVIELRYQRLLAAPIPKGEVSELLARTHALILYQIMLFFDDSCTGRALAEETLPALSDSAMALLEFARHDHEDEENDNPTNPSRNIPLYPLTAARALYNDWTFHESLRRTLLISFIFTQLQCLLRADFADFMPQCFAPSTSPDAPCLSSASESPSFNPPDATALAAIRYAMQTTAQDDEHECKSQTTLCRSFTLSAHLWHASDAVEFAIAWRDKKHLVAEPWNVWKQIETARADDIDQLGRVLMTSAMGIEEAKGWFVSRGGSL